MNAECVEQLIEFLEEIAYQTHENSSRLAALDRTLSLHQEVNSQYKEAFGRLRFGPANRCDSQKVEAALESLRQALLQEQPPFPTATAGQSPRVKPRRHRRTAKKKQQRKHVPTLR